MNQPGQRDLNFNNVLKFRTSDEHRPVFVSVAGIDARSGVLSTATSRRTSAFGTVLQTRSDLASVAKQLTLTLVPSVFEATGKFYLSAAYTIGSVREAARGIDRTAFDAPMVRSWQRSPLDIRHAILIQAGVAGKAASFTMYGRFASGQPFTPVVDRDVNGDGLANDRAFLFDPAAPSTNGQLASELRSLLSTAPRGIRACLIRQTGRAGSPGSCEGPWTATLNAHVAVRLVRSSDSELSIAIANVPALLDQLFNRDQLRGWGSQLSPDAVLLRVREFDAVTQRYAYSVNPRFGSTQNQRGTALNPFRISFSCRVSLGPSRQLQEVRRLLNPALRSLRDGRLDRRGFTSRLRRLGPEPYRTLMEFSDSLLLNEDQLRALAEADVGYHARADEVWGRLADSLTARAQEFDEHAALRHQERSIDEVWEIARLHVQSTLGVVLTDLQRSMLPWPTNVLFTSPSPIVGMRTHDVGRP